MAEGKKSVNLDHIFKVWATLPEVFLLLQGRAE